jgi:hypothetical protein
MPCLGEIDAGAERARQELLFLAKLIQLVQFASGVERQPNIAGAFGFADIYRCPTCGAADFIRMNKASERLLESLSALRVYALECVGRVVEMAEHNASFSGPISASPSASEFSDSSDASARTAQRRLCSPV